ncbi:MAG: hypothetical protein IJD99_08770 [Clostridia bacterium]|nr:hypothetical protein [Clostridia bacterium]
MFRRNEKKHTACTKPDHRPMLPEFRTVSDPVEETIRDIRRRWQEMKTEFNQNWR